MALDNNNKVSKETLEADKALSDNFNRMLPVYKLLNGKHWNRVEPRKIVVWTSGYITQECMDLERALLETGLLATVSQDFDSVCGKTCTMYRYRS